MNSFVDNQFSTNWKSHFSLIGIFFRGIGIYSLVFIIQRFYDAECYQVFIAASMAYYFMYNRIKNYQYRIKIVWRHVT